MVSQLGGGANVVPHRRESAHPRDRSHPYAAIAQPCLQITATSTTAAILLLIAVGGLIFGNGDWNHFSAGGWPTTAQWPTLAIGLVYITYAYAGWNGAAYLAGEIRDPVRNLPRCLIGGAATVVILYLLVNLAYVYALDAPRSPISQTTTWMKSPGSR